MSNGSVDSAGAAGRLGDVDVQAAGTRTTLRTAGIWTMNGHILLESFTERELWGVPGGKLEQGESVEEGCIREYLEETGVRMTCEGMALVNELFYSKRGETVREYCFYVWVRPEAAELRSGEALPKIASREKQIKFAWLPLKDLSSHSLIPTLLATILPCLEAGETSFVSVREEPYSAESFA